MKPQADNPFTATYFAFLRYFQDVPLIEPYHVIISANFTYGWMPTMLRFQYPHPPFDTAATILNHARAGDMLTNEDYQVLIDLMNRSIVGVSKLLHFVNPELFAIWDSRVAAYFDSTLTYAKMQRTATYRSYLQTCQAIRMESAFAPVHSKVNEKVGQPVSPLRAIELIMYTGGAASLL